MPREQIDPYKSFFEIFGNAIIKVMPKSIKERDKSVHFRSTL